MPPALRGAALISESGVTLVVSPLLSLIQDQVCTGCSCKLQRRARTKRFQRAGAILQSPPCLFTVLFADSEPFGCGRVRCSTDELHTQGGSKCNIGQVGCRRCRSHPLGVPDAREDCGIKTHNGQAGEAVSGMVCVCMSGARIHELTMYASGERQHQPLLRPTCRQENWLAL